MMEVLTERLSKGTLQHLQALEQAAEELSGGGPSGGSSRVQQERMLRTLQKAVHKLQERRDLLKIQIANSPNKILGPILQEIQESDEESLTGAVREAVKTTADKKALREAVQAASKLKAQELSVSYRLTGCTVHRMSDDSVRIRWDTFEGGEYLQPYYAVVGMQAGGAGRALRVLRHSLPYFLPLGVLTGEHLNGDLGGFVRAVGDHLNALTSRQRQVAEASEKKQKYLKGEIYASNAFNTISFTVSKPELVTPSLDIQLIYDDMQGDRPTRVGIQSSGRLTRAEVGAMKDVFGSKTIAEAITEIFKD